nr:MAG TPA: hypothetical protein [Caudoviricetes sp.]
MNNFYKKRCKKGANEIKIFSKNILHYRIRRGNIHT